MAFVANVLLFLVAFIFLVGVFAGIFIQKGGE